MTHQKDKVELIAKIIICQKSKRLIFLKKQNEYLSRICKEMFMTPCIIYTIFNWQMLKRMNKN